MQYDKGFGKAAEMLEAQALKRESERREPMNETSLRDGIQDLLTGAEQQSQSHTDVAVKCRALLDVLKEDPYLTSAAWSMEDRHTQPGGMICRLKSLTISSQSLPP